MNKNDLIEIVINYLNQKKKMTDLEKDILSTMNTYNTIPFDREAAQEKIIENNISYKDIFIAISTTNGIVTRPFEEVRDEDVKHNLFMQIEALCIKEFKEAGLQNREC